MKLVGRYLSPFTRRVAVALRTYGIPFEHLALSTATDREAIAGYNPLGRVPVLELDDGERLIESAAIIDHLDEVAGPEKALVPPSGPGRREVWRVTGLALGVMEKGVAAYYEETRRPAETVHPPVRDQLRGQVAAGLAALEGIAVGGGWLALGRMTHADVAAVCAVDFVRRVLPDLVPAGRHPRLEDLAARCDALPAFAETRLDR